MKFDKYYYNLDVCVREALKAIEKAEIADRDAQQELKKWPEKFGAVSPEYAAGQARAKANQLEAANAYKAARQNVPEKARKQLAEIRADLETAVGDHFAARPGAVDMQAVTLLQSGILKPAEYVRLVRDAIQNENYTMARLIGQAAHEAAQKAGRDADPLLFVAFEDGKKDRAGEYLSTFDGLSEIAERCFNNPGIADRWGEFSKPLLPEDD